MTGSDDDDDGHYHTHGTGPGTEYENVDAFYHDNHVGHDHTIYHGANDGNDGHPCDAAAGNEITDGHHNHTRGYGRMECKARGNDGEDDTSRDHGRDGLGRGHGRANRWTRRRDELDFRGYDVHEGCHVLCQDDACR